MSGFSNTTTNKGHIVKDLDGLNITVSNEKLTAARQAADIKKFSGAFSAANYDICMGDEEYDLTADEELNTTETAALTDETIEDYIKTIGKDKKQIIEEYLDFRPDVRVAYETLEKLDPEKQKELENTIIELTYYSKLAENLKEYIKNNATTEEELKNLKGKYKDYRHELSEAYKKALFKISDDYIKMYGALSENHKRSLEIDSTLANNPEEDEKILVIDPEEFEDDKPVETIVEQPKDIILEEQEEIDEEESVKEELPDDIIEIIDDEEIDVQESPTSIEQAILDMGLSTISSVLNSVEKGNLECLEFFEKNSEGMYGCSQRVFRNMCTYIYNGEEYEYKKIMKIVNKAIKAGKPIPKITVKYNAKYLEIIDKLKSKGFKESEAFVILESIDDQGACSYAATADNIFYFYRNNPEQFEIDFGYSMYTTIDGKKVLNSPELLLDLWLYANDTENGGTFISGNHINKNMLSDRVDIYGNRMLRTNEQTYLATGQSGINDDVIEGFLKSKNNNISFHTSTIINNISCNELSEKELDDVIQQMKNALNDNKSLRISIYYDETNRPKIFHFNADNPEDSTTWQGKGHSMAITGVTSTGIVVSTKGKKYEIPFLDFMEGGSFIIYNSEMKF